MLYGSQKRYDKNGDGKLSARERQNWYWNTIGYREAEEKRQRAVEAQYAAAADEIADIIDWMFYDLRQLEGDREDQREEQARRIMNLSLYEISAALQTRTMDEKTRRLLRAFWRRFQPTLGESVYQALCGKQLLYEEFGAISGSYLGLFWKESFNRLSRERRVGKDSDLEALLNDAGRLYNAFRGPDAREADLAQAIEPYWAAVRLPEEPEEDEEDDEDEEDEEEEADEMSEPWDPRAHTYEAVPAEKEKGPAPAKEYSFCLVQYQKSGSSYAYLTGGLSVAVGEFVVVPAGGQNRERLARITGVLTCTAEEAPIPPRLAKTVLRKAEQTAFPEPVKPRHEAEGTDVTQPADAPIPDKPALPKEPQAPEPKTETPPKQAEKSCGAPQKTPAQPVPQVRPVHEPKELEKRRKRKFPWKWLLSAAVIAAAGVFIVRPMVLARQEREAQRLEAERQAQAQLEAEQEAQRLEKERLEAERQAAEAKMTAKLKEANLPYPGMPEEELGSTVLGEPGRHGYEYTWFARDEDSYFPVFVAKAEDGVVTSAERRNQVKCWDGYTLLVAPEKPGTYKFPPKKTPSVSTGVSSGSSGNSGSASSASGTSGGGSASSGSVSNGGTTHGPTYGPGFNGLRDEYDDPEELYEDNRDEYEDEDDAWDDWYED